MERYEFSDGKSNKFWQIEQIGAELHISWGKIGTSGQSQVKDFDSDAKAEAAKAKLIKEKTGKGYVAAGEAPMAAGATLKVAKPPAASAPPAQTSPAAPVAASATSPASVAAVQAQARTHANEDGGEGEADLNATADPSPAGAPISASTPSPANTAQPAPQAAPSLTADADTINAALATRRAAPSFDEAAWQAWPQVLQALVDGEFDNTSAKSFTPSRVKKRFDLDENAWQVVKGWFEDAHLGSDYGYTTSLYLSANVQKDAQKELNQLDADQQAAQLANLRAQLASAWAPLHAGEPDAAVPQRFGQSLEVREWALPRREAPGPQPLRMPFAQAWRELRRQSIMPFLTSACAPDYQRQILALGERIGQPEVTAPDPVADQALLDAALLMRSFSQMKGDPDLIAAYLVDAYGLPEVVRMVGQTMRAGTEFDSGQWHMVHWRADLDRPVSWHPYRGVLFRLRQHLVHADEATWQASVAAALAVLPEVPQPLQALFGPLFMEAPQVAQAALANLPEGRLSWREQHWLLSCTTEPALVARLLQAPRESNNGLFDMPAAIDDMLLRFGLAALPALSAAGAHTDAAERLVALNHPQALHGMVREASGSKTAQARLKLALARWPLAGAVALARACTGNSKDQALLMPLLRSVLTELGPIASLALPWAEPAARKLLGDMAAKAAPVNLATAADLPHALAAPAWLQPKKRVSHKPLNVTPLALADAEAWRPGEREARLAERAHRHHQAPATSVNASRALELAKGLGFHYRNPKIGYIAECAQHIAAGDTEALIRTWQSAVVRAKQADSYFSGYLNATDIVALPEPMGLAFWNATAGDVVMYDAEAACLQWGVAALPGLVALASARPNEHLAQAAPYGSVNLAEVAARAAFKSKQARALGLRWLLRWPEHAAAGLLPAALGKAAGPRELAGKALRLLAARGHADVVQAVAQRHGDAAIAAAVQAVLDEDPLDQYPAKLPVLPEFWQPSVWARPVLRTGQALGDEALQALGTMLAFPRVEGLYAGIEQVQAACTPASLAEFAWDLFSAWLAAGAVAKDNWAFTTLGLFGDDDTARKLTPLIRAWPGEAAHARAVLGLDVLEAIGTDTALMLLNGIAQKLKFKGLQDKAKEKIEAIAEARGLTAQELEDRIAPDLGLDEQGALVLDFGPRQFKVGFDETLKPWVRDFTGGKPGARLKDLPKPNKADDEALAAEASERYKLLKKDAKTIAAQQIQRLETAMCEQRRWQPEHFRAFIADHPLVRHIAQRLVWGVFVVEAEKSGGGPAIPVAPDEQDAEAPVSFPSHGGTLQTCFRLAEDGSLTTADDEAFALPEAPDAQHAVRIGVPHALHMAPEDAQAFGQLFADYELLQPFAQIGRDTYALTEAERAGSKLTRWVNHEVPTGSVMGLTHKGWLRGDAQDGGWIGCMEQHLASGMRIDLSLDPGMVVGDIGWEPLQKLGEVTLFASVSWQADERTWSRVDEIEASELIRSLEGLR